MVELKKLKQIKDNHIKENQHPKYTTQELSNYEHKQITLKKIKIRGESIYIPPKSAIVEEKKPNSINSKIPVENLQNRMIEENLLFQIEKKKLEIISDDLKDNNISKDYNLIDVSDSNIDDLLENLNKQTTNIDEDKPFLESISFLDDVPKINKIAIPNLDVSNLYAKIDEIEKKREQSKVIQTEYLNQNNLKNPLQNNNKEKKIDIVPLIEKIEIPEIMTLDDDTKITESIKDDFISLEKKAITEKIKESNFVNSNKELKQNPEIENRIKDIKIKADNIKISTPVEYKKENTKIIELEKVNYILPKDYLNSKGPVAYDAIKNKQKINLIYDSEVKSKSINKSEINEKYNIDEFTFVNINYKENSLFYNIIQPELTKTQEETLSEVKRAFLDSIDANYYSFKGDKQGIQSYIKKIFDLTLEKLSFDLTSLEKKQYFNFIKQEFSGLGFLASILEDKNIIEVNCGGVGLPIMVYHTKYGLIQTNLKFEKMSQLNLFVLSLTKVMGLRVNSSQPLINGYLPNGYKVEGLYSVGDTSNKGSSFIIKKYLEEPLTPNQLINLGIGTIDVFSYIWCAIDQNYQVAITGGDSVLLINSIVQLYPNKKIASVQSYDYFKFPQKNWIKRMIHNETALDKKTLLSQTLSERPDYIIVDDFTKELFDTKWYDYSLIYADSNIIGEYIEKVKSIGTNTIIIYLDRIKSRDFEQTQILKIIEIDKGKEQKIIEFNIDDGSYHFNLVPSNINIVDFLKKQKLLRWISDTDISDYLDFNNLINDYYLDSKKLFNKLNIIEKEQ